MRLLVLSLLLLLGCKTESHTHLVQHVPVFTNTIQLSETEISYTPEDTSEALIVFYDTWIQFFGEQEADKVLDVLANLNIYYVPENWVITPFKIFSESGEPDGDGKKDITIRGLAINKHTIKVASNSQPISKSSLAHELVHVVLWNLYPSSYGDPDHLGDKYPGWTKKHSLLKDTVNLRLALKGK